MATEPTALRVSELDHASIKENLKNYLRNQEEFQDFDFTGSGLDVLLDILAYNTHMMGFYMNMLANESFLDSAQLRSSVISQAKLMKYEPGSHQGALSRIDIVATPSVTENQAVTSITLEKYTRLLGTDIDGVNYPFVTLYSNTASKDSGSFSFSNVYVKQGEVVTLQYQMTSTNADRSFIIPSSNVDTTSISITVQESSTNTEISTYTKANDITELTSNSTVYFIQENENSTYTLYFGDGVIGKRPKNGNIIICTYLDTVGVVSNNITNFYFVDPVAGLFSDNVQITSAVSSYGGVPKETVDQVRWRAPYFYSTQNRAVNINDYKILILKDYNYIDAISVWGGEDNDPVIYGKVFVSLKTSGNFQLTNLEKERIKDDLIRRRNVMTITPEIVDPDYTFLLLRGRVYYNSQLTSYDASQIQNLVRAAIFDYNDSDLNSFDSTFRKSKLQRTIENSDRSITGSDIDVYLQKRITLDTTNIKSYTVDFKVPLKRLHHEDRLYSYPEIAVFDSAGVSRNVFIEEVPSTDSGIYSIEVTDGGRSYTSAPTVTITGDGRGATAEASLLSGRIDKITITNPGTDYSTAVVSLSGGEGLGATVKVVLSKSIGTLRTFYYRSNGEKVIVNENAGSINYSTGSLTLEGLRTTGPVANEFYDDSTLTIAIQPENEIISTSRNRIVAIDEGDSRSVQVNMVAQ